MNRAHPLLISITSLPSRIGSIRPCLESLLAGTILPDKIIVVLPSYSIRERSVYAVPEFLQSHDFLGNIIEVVRVDPDWGPGTKLLGALTALRHPSYLILADDDVRYKPQFVEGLAFAQVQDHTASFSYFTYRASGLTVGQGCDGFSFWSPNVADIYSFFKNHIDGRALFFHDDLWVSFFLATRGIRVKSLRGSLKGALIYEVEHNINALRSLDGPFARETLNQQAVKGLLRGVQVPFGCRLRIHTRAYCDQLVEEPCRRLLNKISRVRDRG